MANKAVRYGLAMRKTFKTTLKSANWYPRHMAHGFSRMQQKIRGVDCIIEVHDARIPLSGRNPLFIKQLLPARPYILVFNKMDLVDKQYQKSVIQHYKEEGTQNILYTNCLDKKNNGVSRIVPMVSRVIKESERYHMVGRKEFNLMVIGIPNVGKSSLINILRQKYLLKSIHGSLIGSQPGVTKKVMERIKVCANPPVYLLDTPGVLSPKIDNIEMGLKLSLAGTILDNIAGEDYIADYLLYALNKQGNHMYVDYMLLDEPTDDIQKVMLTCAVRNNWMKKVRTYSGYENVPDVLRCASRFISGFRKCHFGPVILDEVQVLE